MNGTTSPEAPSGDVYVWPLEHRARAVAAARRMARTVLTHWSLDEQAVYDATVIVSELVTNAVEHALPPVTLHLQRQQAGGAGVVHIEVTDGGPAPSAGAWVTSCAPEEHGRGSAIVDMLGFTSGARDRGSASAHWAELELQTA
ncbi:ATP-binding protein [Streptomyces sp. NPDC012935]|uniref:ATP-binding protein n=1 Tax=Streptomyces sp. NPDC012935 TaxID=3364857 RepID=UPI0036C4A0C6